MMTQSSGYDNRRTDMHMTALYDFLITSGDVVCLHAGLSDVEIIVVCTAKKKLSTIDSRRQTDRVTTSTRAGLGRATPHASPCYRAADDA